MKTLLNKPAFTRTELDAVITRYASGLILITPDESKTLALLRESESALFVNSDHFEDFAAAFADGNVDDEVLELQCAAFGENYTEVDTPLGNFQVSDALTGDVTGADLKAAEAIFEYELHRQHGPSECVRGRYEWTLDDERTRQARALFHAAQKGA